ncbi:hypothetical protein O4215_20590 [Rhodococcus maanshanensis]|uniref:hypothetical protein n=1 Tax=Rhodococcus maanshanensis TaxID=183556 RepID=UPI0022B42315|nr:hypothetical protein [Rhodococcus maanshanensis]MCZ4557963.1 hypothetical protein [Rhodococcus maanshanensis]
MNDEWDRRAPCPGQPGFLQPGEQENWHLNPETVAAQQVCATACPVRLECVRRARTSGTHGHVADGVVAGGIICRGDTKTMWALRDLEQQLAPVAAQPAACLGCERTFVESGYPTHSGTAHHAGRGLCHGCYSAARRTESFTNVRAIRPTHCIGPDCGKPMVSNREKPGPGQVRHHAKSLCTRCSEKSRTRTKKAA